MKMIKDASARVAAQKATQAIAQFIIGHTKTPSLYSLHTTKEAISHHKAGKQDSKDPPLKWAYQ